jgi:hypothetical protein
MGRSQSIDKVARNGPGSWSPDDQAKPFERLTLISRSRAPTTDSRAPGDRSQLPLSDRLNRRHGGGSCVRRRRGDRWPSRLDRPPPAAFDRNSVEVPYPAAARARRPITGSRVEIGQRFVAAFRATAYVRDRERQRQGSSLAPDRRVPRLPGHVWPTQTLGRAEERALARPLRSAATRLPPRLSVSSDCAPQRTRSPLRQNGRALIDLSHVADRSGVGAAARMVQISGSLRDSYPFQIKQAARSGLRRVVLTISFNMAIPRS